MTALSLAAQARSRIREIAGSKWGMAASDIASRVQHKLRSEVRIEFARMTLVHELHPADQKSRSPRYFRTAEAADAWIAAGKPMRPRDRPGRPMQVMPSKTGLSSIYRPGQQAHHWQSPKPAQASQPLGWDRKPTPCPNYRDERFTFTPPPGWVGEITRDWAAARGEVAT